MRIDTPLGQLRIEHPPGTFAPTPATRVMVRAITGGAVDLAGRGVDWGCGTGVLSLAAALHPAVEAVVGLDISGGDILVARLNARVNGLAEKARFFEAEGYRPLRVEGRRAVEALRGRAMFVIANPPASEGDDGFSFRHMVLQGAGERLAPGGVVLMQALSAYGPERVARLVEAVPGFTYEGVAERTRPVPLGLADRPDLLRQLEDYVAEERRGGLPYRFEDPAGLAMDAIGALRRYESTGLEPLARWQVHRFRRTPAKQTGM